MASKHTDYTGQVLDNRYRVVQRLAEGGMGSVYLGQHITVGRRVAVKFLNEDLTEKDEIVLRFLREAQAAAAIRHKNIIDVWDVGTSAQGDPYLVMEYLEGESLADMLKRTGPIDLPAACAILEPMLSALGAAHEKGIIHRDIKPDNIFLTRVPGEPESVIKLIDFGVSKFTAAGQTKMTVAGTQFGTPAYMAPEQIRGEEDLDHRADLYSVGVVLYKMLTDKLPFQGANNLAVFAKVLTEAPVPPEEVYKDFPAEASPLIMRLLSKEAFKRPASAAALIEEIKAFSDYGERHMRLCRYTSGLSEKTFAGGDLGACFGLSEKSPLGGNLGASRPAGSGNGAASTPLRSPSAWTTPTSWSKDTGRSEKKRTGLLIGGALLGLLLAVGATVAIILRPEDGKRPDTVEAPRTSSDLTVAVSPPARSKTQAAVPVPVLTPATRMPAPAALTETVRLEIKGAPKGAVFFYNDTQYDTGTFTVQKSGEVAELKVTAEGYKDFSVNVTPDKDETIDVDLKPRLEPRLEPAAPTASAQKNRPRSSRIEEKPSSSEKTEPPRREKLQTPGSEIIRDREIKRTESFDD